MNNSPYLDLPLFPLADALKAGVKALCATNGGTFRREPHAMPDIADSSVSPLTLRQADEARADFAAISDDLDFIKSQLSRQPDRAWLSRMGLIGFGKDIEKSLLEATSPFVFSMIASRQPARIASILARMLFR